MSYEGISIMVFHRTDTIFIALTLLKEEEILKVRNKLVEQKDNFNTKFNAK